jgi:hypothetical protein
MKRLIGNDKEPAIIRWRQPLGRPECPYSYRWMIDFGRLGSIRLHKWIANDDMRAPHDHQQDFVTLVLKGAYVDISIDPAREARRDPSKRMWDRDVLRRGSIRRRRAEHTHCVQLVEAPCWTLLYFWPPRRAWGFWVPRRLDGKLKFTKANKYFLKHGHHPCDG